VEDLAGILAVERASFATPWTEKMFEEEFGKDWAHVWVAERIPERRVCGFSVFWTAYDEIHLLNIATEPDSRRTGIARAMMQSLLSFAHASAAAHIVLEVRPSNHGAIRLYQQMAFRPVGVRPRYYADNGEDAVVMIRVLRG
jgi:ribosomal-protein-alanine N-acetyltransferase